MSVYDKSLEQIQSSYQFTDLEMAKMDYTLKVFAYELSKLVFFFVFFAVIGKFSEFAVCLVALLPFRWISGGIHLKHYWSCFFFRFFFFCVFLFMGEMFTLPLYAQISLFVLSNLLLFFIGPVPSAKRKVMTKKQYTNKRFLSSLILLVYTILYFALQNVPHRSVVFWSIILQIIQLICAKLTRKGEIYEKD